MSLGIPPETPKGPNLPLFRNLFCGLASPRAVAEQWQSRSGCFLFLGIPKVPGGGFGSRVGCLGYGPMLEAWALEQNHKKQISRNFLRIPIVLWFLFWAPFFPNLMPDCGHFWGLKCGPKNSPPANQFP